MDSKAFEGLRPIVFGPGTLVRTWGTRPEPLQLLYTQFMRRIAALVLLCVFGTLLPSATVIALAAPQQLLPICCRAHGAHSCILGAMATAPSDSGPTLRQPT